MAVQHYQDLIVWQRAMDLVAETYQLVKLLPREELYSLSDQMRRAAVSIPSNIAEGQQRHTKKEYVNFLSIAKGSIAELETQYLICERLQYLTRSQIELPIKLCGEVGKMLNAIISTLVSSD